MSGNRDQQSRRGGKNDVAPARPASALAGKGNRAARSRPRGRRRRPANDAGFERQANQGRGVGSLGLALEGGHGRGGVGSLDLPLEGASPGVGSLGLDLEGRDGTRRPGLGSLDLELEGETPRTGSLDLDLE